MHVFRRAVWKNGSEMRLEILSLAACSLGDFNEAVSIFWMNTLCHFLDEGIPLSASSHTSGSVPRGVKDLSGSDIARPTTCMGEPLSFR